MVATAVLTSLVVATGAVLGLRAVGLRDVDPAATSGPGHVVLAEPAAVTGGSPAGVSRPGDVPDGGARAGRTLGRPAAAVDVLRRWDALRARAFEEGDPVRLRALYVPGSRAGDADVRVLRSYVRRGLRVAGMRTQVLSVEVLLTRPERVRLRVVERLVGAEAVVLGTDRRLPLPRDAASERVVELWRAPAGTWRVASVSG